MVISEMKSTEFLLTSKAMLKGRGKEERERVYKDSGVFLGVLWPDSTGYIYKVTSK